MRTDARRSRAVRVAVMAASLAAAVPCAAAPTAPAALVAQGAAAGGTATVPTATVPDVEIIVSPDPITGQWVVAAVYPGVVTKDKALGRAKALIALTGWKAHDLTFEDGTVHRVLKADGVPPAPTMSSVSFETPDRVVDWRAGTVALEPLIRSYRDLNHLNVLYMIPGSFPFRGLRRYADPNVNVALSAGRGAFAYTVAVKNHGMGAINLPTTEADIRADAAASRAPRAGRSPIGAAAVVAAALLAAVFAFFAVRRWAGRSGS